MAESKKKKLKIPFWNQCFDKSRLKNFVLWFLLQYGEYRTVELLEQFKTVGFEYATKAGLSLGIDDLKIPPKKSSLLIEAENITRSATNQYNRGEITGVERFQKMIDTWHRTSEVLKQEVIDYFELTDTLNPVYMMAFSGARGNISQVRQLVGMRGLMANPQGQILDYPIRSNFREGLSLTEYIISTYGARKGIVDTALRTANAGYLTRRLVDVAQHIIVAHFDCGTQRGIFLTDMKEGNKILYSLQNRLIGRVLGSSFLGVRTEPFISEAYKQKEVGLAQIATYMLDKRSLDNFYSPNYRSGVGVPVFFNKGVRNISLGGTVPFFLSQKKEGKESRFNFQATLTKNTEISSEIASELCKVANKIFVRSTLTCEIQKSVCQLCYGWSLAQGNLVSIGEAIGVIAAQSIGEPGTQLTMRTFHTGGVFSGDLIDQIKAISNGHVNYLAPIAGTLIRTAQGDINFLTKTNGFLEILYYTSGSLVKPNLAGNNTWDYSRINTQKNFINHKKVFKIPPYTLLFIRHGEKIFEKQVIAEISNIAGKFNKRDNGEFTINSELEGEFQLSNLNLIEKKVGYKVSNDKKKQDKNILPFETLLEAGNWGYGWILSGKIYQLPILSNFFPKIGDFVNEKSYINGCDIHINSNGINTGFIQAPLEMNNLITKSLLLSKSILSLEIEKMFYRKLGYFFSLSYSQFNNPFFYLNEKDLIFTVKAFFSIKYKFSSDILKKFKKKLKSNYQHSGAKKKPSHKLVWSLFSQYKGLQSHSTMRLNQITSSFFWPPKKKAKKEKLGWHDLKGFSPSKKHTPLNSNSDFFLATPFFGPQKKGQKKQQLSNAARLTKTKKWVIKKKEFLFFNLFGVPEKIREINKKNNHYHDSSAHWNRNFTYFLEWFPQKKNLTSGILINDLQTLQSNLYTDSMWTKNFLIYNLISSTSSQSRNLFTSNSFSVFKKKNSHLLYFNKKELFKSSAAFRHSNILISSKPVFFKNPPNGSQNYYFNNLKRTSYKNQKNLYYDLDKLKKKKNERLLNLVYEKISMIPRQFFELPQKYLKVINWNTSSKEACFETTSSKPTGDSATGIFFSSFCRPSNYSLFDFNKIRGVQEELVFYFRGPFFFGTKKNRKKNNKKIKEQKKRTNYQLIFFGTKKKNSFPTSSYKSFNFQYSKKNRQGFHKIQPYYSSQHVVLKKNNEKTWSLECIFKKISSTSNHPAKIFSQHVVFFDKKKRKQENSLKKISLNFLREKKKLIIKSFFEPWNLVFFSWILHPAKKNMHVALIALLWNTLPKKKKLKRKATNSFLFFFLSVPIYLVKLPFCFFWLPSFFCFFSGATKKNNKLGEKNRVLFEIQQSKQEKIAKIQSTFWHFFACFFFVPKKKGVPPQKNLTFTFSYANWFYPCDFFLKPNASHSTMKKSIKELRQIYLSKKKKTTKSNNYQADASFSTTLFAQSISFADKSKKCERPLFFSVSRLIKPVIRIYSHHLKKSTLIISKFSISDSIYLEGAVAKKKSVSKDTTNTSILHINKKKGWVYLPCLQFQSFFVAPNSSLKASLLKSFDFNKIKEAREELFFNSSFFGSLFFLEQKKIENKKKSSFNSTLNKANQFLVNNVNFGAPHAIYIDCFTGTRLRKSQLKASSSYFFCFFSGATKKKPLLRKLLKSDTLSNSLAPIFVGTKKKQKVLNWVSLISPIFGKKKKASYANASFLASFYKNKKRDPSKKKLNVAKAKRILNFQLKTTTLAWSINQKCRYLPKGVLWNTELLKIISNNPIYFIQKPIDIRLDQTYEFKNEIGKLYKFKRGFQPSVETKHFLNSSLVGPFYPNICPITKNRLFFKRKKEWTKNALTFFLNFNCTKIHMDYYFSEYVGRQPQHVWAGVFLKAKLLVRSLSSSSYFFCPKKKPQLRKIKKFIKSFAYKKTEKILKSKAKKKFTFFSKKIYEWKGWHKSNSDKSYESKTENKQNKTYKFGIEQKKDTLVLILKTWLSKMKSNYSSNSPAIFFVFFLIFIKRKIGGPKKRRAKKKESYFDFKYIKIQRRQIKPFLSPTNELHKIKSYASLVAKKQYYNTLTFNKQKKNLQLFSVIPYFDFKVKQNFFFKKILYFLHKDYLKNPVIKKNSLSVPFPTQQGLPRLPSNIFRYKEKDKGMSSSSSFFGSLFFFEQKKIEKIKGVLITNILFKNAINIMPLLIGYNIPYGTEMDFSIPFINFNSKLREKNELDFVKTIQSLSSLTNSKVQSISFANKSTSGNFSHLRPSVGSLLSFFGQKKKPQDLTRKNKFSFSNATKKNYIGHKKNNHLAKKDATITSSTLLIKQNYFTNFFGSQKQRPGVLNTSLSLGAAINKTQPSLSFFMSKNILPFLKIAGLNTFNNLVKKISNSSKFFNLSQLIQQEKKKTKIYFKSNCFNRALDKQNFHFTQPLLTNSYLSPFEGEFLYDGTSRILLSEPEQSYPDCHQVIFSGDPIFIKKKKEVKEKSLINKKQGSALNQGSPRRNLLHSQMSNLAIKKVIMQKKTITKRMVLEKTLILTKKNLISYSFSGLPQRIDTFKNSTVIKSETFNLAKNLIFHTTTWYQNIKLTTFKDFCLNQYYKYNKIHIKSEENLSILNFRQSLNFKKDSKTILNSHSFIPHLTNNSSPIMSSRLFSGGANPSFFNSSFFGSLFFLEQKKIENTRADNCSLAKKKNACLLFYFNKIKKSQKKEEVSVTTFCLSPNFYPVNNHEERVIFSEYSIFIKIKKKKEVIKAKQLEHFFSSDFFLATPFFGPQNKGQKKLLLEKKQISENKIEKTPTVQETISLFFFNQCCNYRFTPFFLNQKKEGNTQFLGQPSNPPKLILISLKKKFLKNFLMFLQQEIKSHIQVSSLVDYKVIGEQEPHVFSTREKKNINFRKKKSSGLAKIDANQIFSFSTKNLAFKKSFFYPPKKVDNVEFITSPFFWDKKKKATKKKGQSQILNKLSSVISLTSKTWVPLQERRTFFNVIIPLLNTSINSESVYTLNVTNPLSAKKIITLPNLYLVKLNLLKQLSPLLNLKNFYNFSMIEDKVPLSNPVFNNSFSFRYLMNKKAAWVPTLLFISTESNNYHASHALKTSFSTDLAEGSPHFYKNKASLLKGSLSANALLRPLLTNNQSENEKKSIYNDPTKTKLGLTTQPFALISEERKKQSIKVYRINNLKGGLPKEKNISLFSPKISLGNFFIYGDKLSATVTPDKTQKVAITNPGQIIHFNSHKITLRRGQNFFISPKSILHINHGNFIQKNEPVMTLTYQRLKAGDIVQGIPKVEQFLEARITKQGRLFRDCLPNLLQGLFKRYRSQLPLEQAVRQSFYKLQQIIVDGVLRVYRSQGVTIGDKHLEVIVKQMTSKVKIINGAQTGFFSGEIIDLYFIEKINYSLMKKIQYEPLVLGITRAALEVESFLSAASFQQTTRVLSRAAIGKRKDYLKGLKENILLGNLMPAGTGYLISLDDTIFPASK